MKKRLMSLFLCLCMLITMLPTTAYALQGDSLSTTAQTTDETTENPFKDVKKSDWFYSAVQYAREKGFFAGTSKTTFEPNGTMTRSMFVAVLGRMAGVDTAKYKGESTFSDVEKDAYYAPFVAWASKHGITAGVGNGKFDPDGLITREQMAVFFVRYFETFGVDFDTGANITTIPADIDSVADYAKDAVLKLWKNGLLAGDGINFNPAGNASRAQAAALCTRTDETVKTWYKEPGVPKEETTVIVPPSGGGSSGGGSPGGSPGGSTTTYYKVEFKLGGGGDPDVTLPETKTYTNGTAITTLPTPFKQNTVFLGWYYDEAMTQRVESGDTVTKNMTLYAKMADSAIMLSEGGTPDYVSSVDVNINEFYIQLSENASKDSIKVINISNGNEDVTSSVTVSNGVVRDTWKAGQTYQLEVLDSNVKIYFNGEEQDLAIRFYNFTTEKNPVLNLELNSGLKYIPAADVGGMPEGAPSGLYSVTLQNGRSMLKTTTGSGSFTYTGAESISVGDTVAIYSGQNPMEQVGAADDTGDVAYVTVTGINSDTYSYTVADADDVLFTPDVLPVNTGADKIAGDGEILTVDAATLDFSDDQYMELGLDSRTTVDVGDFIAFYTGEYGGNGAPQVTDYARITEVIWNNEKTICTITYTKVDQSVVFAAMDAYGTKNQEIEISDEEKKRLESEIELQALNSGFAEEAAQYLAALALETDGFQTLSDDMDLKSYSFTIDDGTDLTQGGMTLMDSSKVSIEELKVNANISKNLKHFDGSTGLRVALNVSFSIIVGPEDGNHIEITVQAIFEQEVLLDLNISGDAVWKWAWIIPYIYDYRINTNLDVGTYTGVGITATAMSKSAENKWDWDEYDTIESIGLQIQNLMKEKERFLGEEVDTVGGGLAEKYARMLENESDWVELFSVNLFGQEVRALLGILVIGVSVDFVVSANMNITIGMSFEYATAKRYNFSLMLFHKKSSSNTIDLEPEHYQFDLYVMGTLGIRAGIRLTIYAGLFHKDFASIGITAETGVYAQLWGYFYYSLHWDAGTKIKTSSYSGALLVEVGIYLEIKFLASAFGGTFQYNPTLYEKTWPLWQAGSRENVQGFAEVEANGLHYDIRIVTSFSLPTSLFDMRYMDLTSGEVYGNKEDDGSWYKNEDGDELPALNFDTDTEDRFLISFSDPRFAYDPKTNTVTVSPNEGEVLINAEMTITWKGGPLTFTSKPITRTLKIKWSDPKNSRFIAFNSNGGSAVQMISAAPDANIIWPQGPAKQGYIFDGWYTEKELLNSYTPISKMPAFSEENKGITLYAKWVEAPNSYTVNVYQQALNGTYELVESGTINKDKSNNGIKTNGKANWHLTNDGWTIPATGFVYNQAATDINKVIAANGSTVVKVIFDRMSGTVTFNYGKLKAEGSDDTKDIVNTYKYGASVYAPSVTIGGYIFTGWADESGNPVTFDNMTMGTANMTYYAQWEADTNTPYRVEYYVQDTRDDAWYYQSAVPGTGTTDSVVDLAPYLNPETGLNPGNVTVDGTEVTDANKSTLLKIKGNGKLVIKIYYDREILTVRFLNTVDEMPLQNVRYGGIAIKPADPQKVGYTFSHWCTDENCTSDNTCTNAWDFETVLTSDAELYAAWTPNSDTAYKVEYYEMGVGGSYPSSATRTVNKTGETDTDITAETSGAAVPIGFAFDSGNENNRLTGKISANGSSVLKVYLSRKKYTLTFDANGGTGDTETNVYHGAEIIPPTVSREGYNLSGWAPSVAATMPIGNITYTAQWTGWNYTVVFDPNVPGEVTASPGTIPNQSGFVYGTMKVLNPSIYELPGTGYTFIGWNTDKTKANDGIVQYNDKASINIMPSANNGIVTLYAVWKQGEATTYTVKHSFMNLDGTTYTVDEAKTQKPNGIVGASSNAAPLTVDGFEAEIVTQKIIEADTTVITIQYTRKQYTLAWNLGGGTATNEGAYTIGTVYYGAPITVPVLTKNGHSYEWNETPAETMPAADKTYTSVWTPNSHAVTIVDGVTGGTTTSKYGFGTTVALNPGTKAGHKFINWSVNSGNVTISNNSFLMPDNAVSITANWERTQSIITWNLNGGTVTYNGEPTSGPVQMTGNTGDSFTALSAPTRVGYTFTGWDKTVPSVMPDNDMTIAAKWNKVTITLTFDGIDGATMGEIKDSYQIGDTGVVGSTLIVNIPMLSKTGYTFNGWTLTGSGGLSQYSGGDQTLTAEFGTANASITLKANWTANQYPYTLVLDYGTLGGETGGAEGTITKNHTYGQITNLSTFVPTRTGHTFLGWYDGGTRVTEIPANTEPANKVYTAKWQINKYLLTVYQGTTGSTESGYVTFGDPVTLNAGSKTGYTFQNWTVLYDSVTLDINNSFTMPANDVYVYANWIGNDVTITWMTDHGTTPETITKPAGSGLTLPQLSEENWVFEGWFMDSNLTQKLTDNVVPITDDPEITLYAKWSKKTYTITFNKNGGTGGVDTLKVPYNETKSLLRSELPKRTNLQFAGYYDADGTWYFDSTGYGRVAITEDIELIAKWNCDIFVQAAPVTSDNMNDILGDGGTVSYNSETNVLTLNNASFNTVYNSHVSRWGISGAMHSGIEIGGNLTECTIEVIGTNTITANEGTGLCGIKFEGGILKFTGNGSLTIDTSRCIGYGDNYPISLYKYNAGSNLIIDGPEINAIARYEAVAPTGWNCGVYAAQITVNSGSLLAAGSNAVKVESSTLIPTTQSGKTLIFRGSETYTTNKNEITEDITEIWAGTKSVYITVN